MNDARKKQNKQFSSDGFPKADEFEFKKSYENNNELINKHYQNSTAPPPPYYTNINYDFSNLTQPQLITIAPSAAIVTQ